MRVLVCGGRDYNDKDFLFAALDKVHSKTPISVLIEGGASGADRLASQWACLPGVLNQRFTADWATHGRAAGPIRNKTMLIQGKPDLVVAFPGGRGTDNMIKQAREAGVQVIEAKLREKNARKDMPAADNKAGGDEPVAYIQRDHLQKAMASPFLCRVEPTQRLPDFVPLYTRPQPQADIDAILIGIDKEETEHPDGWWQTSTGAKFGADKLRELKAALFNNRRQGVATMGEYRVSDNFTHWQALPKFKEGQ